MAKYYEDKKLIETIHELYFSTWAQGFEDEGIVMHYYHNGIKDALKMLGDIVEGDVPECLKVEAADVEPVKAGKWEKGGDYYWYCSRCGSRHTKTDVIHCKFCPDCGACMNAKGDA